MGEEFEPSAIDKHFSNIPIKTLDDFVGDISRTGLVLFKIEDALSE